MPDFSFLNDQPPRRPGAPPPPPPPPPPQPQVVHIHHVYTPSPARVVASKPKPKSSVDAAGCMAAIVMAGIVGWCLYMCAGIKPQTEAQFNAADNSMQALMDAQDHIKSMLKSPGSAKWPSLWGNDRPLNGVARLPDGTYMVTSFVDSQNGFGALVRTWFRVHIRVKQSGRPDILSAEFLGPQ